VDYFPHVTHISRRSVASNANAAAAHAEATADALGVVTITVEADAGLELRNASGYGFEVLVPPGTSTVHQRAWWCNSPITAVTGKTITITGI
jgi:hypothetical protein